MSRAWLLPEHLADVLPDEARRVEWLRRRLVDQATFSGFELVMPPLLEHLESLLTGTGRELDLRTFKLVDQLGGRTLGLRADTTPQAARIDAHLLNRAGVTRLCYCGPVLHTRPAGVQVSREPLQFGAELFGHAGLEADLEVLELALDGLTESGFGSLTLDLADARILRGVLAGVPADAQVLQDVVAALAHKDEALLADLSRGFPAPAREGLLALLGLYGGLEVLDRAEDLLPDVPLVRSALGELRLISRHIGTGRSDLTLGVDLGDASGYAYYSGPRFSVYASGCPDALARGGRYDEVGAAFGRNRPAVGFSVDLKVLAARLPAISRPAAVRAPWSEDAALRSAVRRLRDGGETVVYHLPGDEPSQEAFAFDRELAEVGGRWVLRAL